jgi:hypothetical protein
VLANGKVVETEEAKEAEEEDFEDDETEAEDEMEDASKRSLDVVAEYPLTKKARINQELA